MTPSHGYPSLQVHQLMMEGSRPVELKKPLQVAAAVGGWPCVEWAFLLRPE